LTKGQEGIKDPENDEIAFQFFNTLNANLKLLLWPAKFKCKNLLSD